MCICKHMIKSWSTTQQTVAMFSAEDEQYAMVKGAAQTKGLISMIQDYGIKIDGCVCSDAAAAIGIVHRQARPDASSFTTCGRSLKLQAADCKSRKFTLIATQPI